MNKLPLMLVMLLAGATSFAQSDVSEQALKSLMNQNALVQSPSGKLMRVNSAIAQMMTSSFNDKGEGSLSVVTNKCKAQGNVYKCRLNILNSDRKLDAAGAYVPADDMTESSLTIDYKVNGNGKIMIGKPTAFFAG